MRTNNKKILIIASTIVLILCGVMITMFYPKKISPENIFISEVSVGEKVIVKGNLMESALDYKGYKAVTEQGKLYLELKGSLLSLRKRDGAFTVTLDIDKSGKPEEIYLRNEKKNIKIWP